MTGRLLHIASGTGTPMVGPSGYSEPSEAVQSLTYSYDEMGRVKTKGDWILGTQEVYQQYDNLDRLVNWTNGDGTHSVTYDYSDLGNLTARHDNANRTQTDEIYSYGVGAGPHAVTGGPMGSYGYDPNGRQTSRPGEPLLSYNRFDLPDSVQHENITTVFKYDAGGTRAEKQTGTSSTVYVGGLYERREGAAGVQHFFYVPGAQGVVTQLECDGLNGSATCGAFTYLHPDRSGTVDTISGSNIVHISHDPYGRMTGASGEVTLGFTGEEEDAELGLVNLNHRLYDPKSGRFLSPDPLVGSVLSAQGHNRYAYALNSPTLFTDRTGLETDADNNTQTGDQGAGPGWAPTGPAQINANGVLVQEFVSPSIINPGTVADPTEVPAPSSTSPPDLRPQAGADATTVWPQTSATQGGSMLVQFGTDSGGTPTPSSAPSHVDWLTHEPGKATVPIFGFGGLGGDPTRSFWSRLLTWIRGGAPAAAAAPAALVLSRFASDPVRLNVLQQIYQNGLRVSQTVAQQLAVGGARAFIPLQAILETVGNGMRSVDPQGVANQFMYYSNVIVNSSSGVLEVLVNEETWQVYHVLFISGASLQ